MNIVYLLVIVLTLSAQNITKKGYTQKSSGGVYTFSILTCLAAALFFVLTSKGFQFEKGVVPYALAFAAAYCTTTVFSVLAISCGSLSLTNLMISYSLMIPALYGVFFLKEDLSAFFYPGIIMLACSLFLINEQGEKTKVRFKWILYVVLAAVGNGMCSVFQKMQQVKFDGLYKNELMIIALVAGALGLTVVAIIRERKEILPCVKAGWFYAILGGVCNGIVNLFVMILSGRMSASLMFPLISAGGIVVTYVISKYFYKENLTRKQFIGFLLGIGSVVFLNL